MTTRRPLVTTYRPVPDYLGVNENLDIAHIIADLLVEHIEKASENDGKSENKRLMELLAALTSLEDEDGTQPPLPPGPPYLPPNSLPPNSLTRPPYLFPSVRPSATPPLPPPPLQLLPPRPVDQNIYQTNFNKKTFQSNFLETRPIKPIIKGLKNSKKKQKNVVSIDSMIKNLLGNEVNSGFPDKKISRPKPKRPPQYYPFPKQFETKFPVQDIPERKPAKKKAFSSFSRYPINAKKKPSENDVNSAFSRYPIKIPQIKQNQHFSLPIDSLADFNRRKTEKLNSRNSQIVDEDKFISFSDQLRTMLEDLGGRKP